MNDMGMVNLGHCDICGTLCDNDNMSRIILLKNKDDYSDESMSNSVICDKCYNGFSDFLNNRRQKIYGVHIKDMNVPSSCESCKLKQFVGTIVIKGYGSKALYECPFCDNTFTLDGDRQASCKLEPAE